MGMNVELQLAATMFIEVLNLLKSYMSKGLDKSILETWSTASHQFEDSGLNTDNAKLDT
jgi:hypothetical protein